MKIERKQEDFRIRNVKRIKRSRFPMSLFAIYLGVVLLMAGVHTGISVSYTHLDVYKRQAYRSEV